MLFNSISFALFLPVVFILYWFIKKGNILYQNSLLLVASYFFYACWDFRFLFLLIFSTFLDYFTGIKISKAVKLNRRKFWFILSLAINLGFLGVFKYYNFFSESFSDALSIFGIKTNFYVLNLVLPVGISFYTFHGISYVVDIYKNRIKPEFNLIDYSLFVCFFPLLVAGPIERATHLLPQIKIKRGFNYSTAIDGLRQILWGLFKKIVIADNCAEFTSLIFDNHANYSASTLFLGGVFFAFQLYADFSGYSDIALGTARLFGIELMQNFNSPFMSKNMSEFWRRWHISLSSWFNDYVFTPLATYWRNFGLLGISFALLVTFFLSGIWHGANWTFIIYGLMHGIAIVFELNTKKIRKKLYQHLPKGFKSIIGSFVTLTYVYFSWIFFRSENVGQAISYISEMFSFSFFSIPEVLPKPLILLILFFSLIEIIGREQKFAIQVLGEKWPRNSRRVLYYTLMLMIYIFTGAEQEFIYFQF